MSVIVLTPDQLKDMLSEAAERGAALALARAKKLLQPETAVPRDEAMRIAGYKDEGSFRAFCKSRGIVPERRAGRNYYLPSQLIAS